MPADDSEHYRRGEPGTPEAEQAGPGRPGREDLLASAYDRRTSQVHEARAALAEAVSALTVEAVKRREEAAALADERDRAVCENRALRERAERAEAGADALMREARALREQQTLLEARLRTALAQTGAARNTKAGRWSARARRVLDRRLARRG